MPFYSVLKVFGTPHMTLKSTTTSLRVVEKSAKVGKKSARGSQRRIFVKKYLKLQIS